jgi:hypothetical protein
LGLFYVTVPWAKRESCCKQSFFEHAGLLPNPSSPKGPRNLGEELWVARDFATQKERRVTNAGRESREAQTRSALGGSQSVSTEPRDREVLARGAVQPASRYAI